MKNYRTIKNALRYLVLLAVFLAAFTARAELIAYDQFTGYTDGNLAGQNQGFGFAGWYAGNNGSGPNDTAALASNAGNLSYALLATDGGGGVAGTGATDDNIYFGRNLTTAITNSGTYYFGFLLQQTGNANAKHNYIRLQSSNGYFAGAGSWNSSTKWQLIRYQGSYVDVDTDTGINETSDVAHFVLKFIFNTNGNETAYLYVNPEDADELENNGNAATNYTFSSQWTNIQKVQGHLDAGGINRTMAFDEIRVGTEAADMFAAPDQDPPTAGPLSPTNGAVDVGIADNFMISFSENVQAGSGSILVKKTADDSTHETVPVSDTGRVTFSTTNVTINVDTNLSLNTGYYILITNGVIEDLSGNSFAGLTNTTDWAFTTLAVLPAPGVTTAGGATDIGIGTASLRAELTNGVAANVYICWGADAGNTLSTSSWQNVVSMGVLSDGEVVTNDLSGLFYGVEYDYVVYASNSTDVAWSGVTNFTTLPPTWSPALIATEAWYDASDTNTITLNVVKVSEWQDKSGKGNHATQGTDSKRPTTGGDIGGLNAIAFDPSSGQYLTNALEQLTTVSIYIVINPTARGTGYGCPLSACATGYAPNSGLFWPVEEYSGSVERNDVHYTDSLLDKVYCNGVKNSADHNFEPAILSHQGTGLPTANLNYLIGQRSWNLNGSFAYKGLIGEIIICPVEHDTRIRQKIEGYLAHKWGLADSLPIDHPYRNTPPPASEGTVFRFR